MGKRIAHINHDEDLLEDIKAELEEKGMEVDSARTLREFENNYGSLDDYSTLIYHPGIEHQTDLKEIVEENPHLKIGIVTSNGDSYRVYSNTTCLEMPSPKTLVDFVKK